MIYFRMKLNAHERMDPMSDALIGAVGRPQVSAGQAVPEVVGQVLAQLDRVAVRVPVQGGGGFGDRVTGPEAWKLPLSGGQALRFRARAAGARSAS